MLQNRIASQNHAWVGSLGPLKIPDVCMMNGRQYSILWVWPPPSNSDHQDYYIFYRESQPKPSFATITGRGPHPKYTHHSLDLPFWQWAFLKKHPRTHCLKTSLEEHVFERQWKPRTKYYKIWIRTHSAVLNTYPKIGQLRCRCHSKVGVEPYLPDFQCSFLFIRLFVNEVCRTKN